jgi:Flp pilus assembly protein TadG
VKLTATSMASLRARRKSGPDAGAVATEFALLMAFVPLTVIAFGIVDYGEFMAQATNLAAVIRGAAEYARGQVVQGNALPTAANLNALLGVPAEVFTTLSFCSCADNTPVACPGAGDANPCAASPPANGDMRVLKYVAVSGAQAYTPIISGTWSFPGSVPARTVLRTQ